MEEGQPLWSSGFPQEEPLARLVHLELAEILHFKLNQVEDSNMFAGIWVILG